MTTRWRWSPRRKCAPAAWPILSAISAVIGILLVRPRIPSVPKNLRVIFPLAFPAVELACGLIARAEAKGEVQFLPRRGRGTARSAVEALALSPAQPLHHASHG